MVKENCHEDCSETQLLSTVIGTVCMYKPIFQNSIQCSNVLVAKRIYYVGELVMVLGRLGWLHGWVSSEMAQSPIIRRISHLF